ncbi:unnamed protein product [Moneuplotes crassus]|uniref:Uncharacterized protein n=1 Tax=Euplotes crassus TaxID=5936 RepID=A0AAD1XQ24_EUPCR|nr:unnamed protein product [Moneuplotes crassus]
MSKRKSDNTNVNKDTEQVSTRSQYKRARHNEEDNDASPLPHNNEEEKDNTMQGNNPLEGNFTNDNAPARFFDIFLRIIKNLHSFSQNNPPEKAKSGNEEQKVSNLPLNHDESVRLQQEHEVEEIENKSNRDTDSNKLPKDFPKIQEKLEESKNITQKSPPRQIYQKEVVKPANPPPAPSSIPVSPPVQSPPPQPKPVQPAQSPPPVAQTQPQRQLQQSPYKQNFDYSRQNQPEAHMNTAPQAMPSRERPPTSNQPVYMQSSIPTLPPNIQSMTKYQQPQMQQRTGMPSMMSQQPPPQFYSRPTSNSPPIHMMAQSRQQVLPNFQNLQPMIQSQYPYSVRTPQNYIPMNIPKQNMGRQPTVSGQLPKLNQLAGLFNQVTFPQQQTQPQIPPHYLQQAQLKNLIMSSQNQRQAMLQGLSGQPNLQSQNRQPQGRQNQPPNWNPNGKYN